MKSKITTSLLRILFLTLLLGCSKATSHFLSAKLPKSSRQLVVVRSPNEQSSQAKLQRLEKHRAKWQPVGNEIKVSLGRSGLAPSGQKMASANQKPKQEGDGKSPAGLFSFGSVFGYAPATEADFKMPYSQADEALECVDDSNSKFYNQLVDNRKVPKDWASSEFMHRKDHQYRWGIFVNHNTSPTLPMGGSCIFLHIWREPNSPTSGCTAMSEEELLELLHWLDPEKSPRLLQVLEADYPTYQKIYKLPELANPKL
ncbi:MAG: L,D-transpeptidase family protein [Saprospiraceae bacterium]|nr:L,D-transpeptidase family protein [Saprospiraceae bacterium]